MAILQWDKNQSEIVDRLKSGSKLKICCKTLSEPEFVKEWVDHHSSIVGLDNLIIADNGSTDDATLDVYASLGPEITIFQFSGSHNDIHWHPRFLPLFDRLRQTVDFFTFIDVDERLVWIDHDKWSADRQIVDFLQDPKVIYPTTWIINAIGRTNRFTLLDTERRRIFLNNLKWGKPIFPHELIGTQPGIHNVQYNGSRFAEERSNHLFLLHLTQFPDQRIAANVRKLANRKLIDHSIDPILIPKMDFSKHPDPTVLRFQREIEEMLAYLNGDQAIPNKEFEFIELSESGAVTYSNAEARQILTKFIDNGAAVGMEFSQ
jgi:hypothetical protein